MTFREQYMKDHPDEDASMVHEKMFCPDDMKKGKYCPAGSSCKACWDREITEKKPASIVHYVSDEKCEPIAKVDKVVEENGGITVHATPVIKDSGNRTEFDSGAVRDMREGKGRCDLMPLEVVADLYKTYFGEEDSTYKLFINISQFMNTKDSTFLRKAIGEFLDDSNFTSWSDMFLEVAKHFEEGAKKYGENNWQKGIPVHCYIDSAVRHYLKWLRGDMDEPHDRAFVWNIMCCIWEVDYREKKDE